MFFINFCQLLIVVILELLEIHLSYNQDGSRNILVWIIPFLFFLAFVISPRYLCKLSDQELRQSTARNMADLMWSTVKEPLDTALCFDKESLDLAFKYFMSPTLTMRLAGLSQITVRTFWQYKLYLQKKFLVLYDSQAYLGGFFNVWEQQDPLTCSLRK